ncbi:MAG: T9SS type A sorting domain-containing protein [Bacteroidetes bacterium]|nr:T9SS type A sorting domain-containing protein [Bacteroidota bacterium]
MKKAVLASIVAFAAGILFFTWNNFLHQNNSEKSSANKISVPAKENDEKDNDALDALQWLSKTRAYPNADIPNDAYVNAWKMQNSRYANPNTTTVGTWTSIGPNNVGGRTLCVALDPLDTNTVWLGSASGGLWKSTVGGLGVNAWTYVNTGFPVLGVATIAINPANHLEMYIGTGEAYNYGMPLNGLTDRTTRGSVGMGILKSTDGGATWSYSLNWTYQQMRGVWEISINPLKPSSVIAATTEGIYKSTNSGTTWTQVQNATMAMDIAWFPSDTTIVLCGTGNMNSTNKGLYRSTDGGSTWALAGGGFPNATAHAGRTQIAFDPNNNNAALVQMSDIYNTIGFYKTTDKGATWSTIGSQDVTGYQGWYCEGMAIEQGNSNNILAGGVNMMLSNDNAASFNQVSNNFWTTDYMHSDVHDIVVNPQNANSIFIATDGGLFRSWDFGVSYTECTDGYVTSQHYIGSCSQTNANYLLSGLQDNYTQMYTGSVYWTPVVGGDGCYNAIDPTNDQIAYGASQYLNVEQTFDQWFSSNTIISTPSSATGGNPAAFLAPYILAPNNNNRIYAAGTGLQRSDDQGFTFNTVSADPIDAGNYILSIGCSYTQSDSVYIATAPDFGPMHFMISINAGVTFTDRSTGLPDRYPRRITVDPRNSKIVYVVFSGFGTGHIYKTTDAGITWADMSSVLPDAPFHCLMCDPQFPDIIYAGCDVGMYVSTNGGQTWITHNTGFPDYTMVFDIVPSNSDRGLLAFTHGHGVYKRSMNDISGISDPSSVNLSVNIFPNPASDVATISYGELYSNTTMKIYDLEGKLMEEQQLQKNSSYTHVDVSAWVKGVYLVNISSGKATVTKKMIVTK